MKRKRKARRPLPPSMELLAIIASGLFLAQLATLALVLVVGFGSPNPARMPGSLLAAPTGSSMSVPAGWTLPATELPPLFPTKASDVRPLDISLHASDLPAPQPLPKTEEAEVPPPKDAAQTDGAPAEEAFDPAPQVKEPQKKNTSRSEHKDAEKKNINKTSGEPRHKEDSHDASTTPAVKTDNVFPEKPASKRKADRSEPKDSKKTNRDKPSSEPLRKEDGPAASVPSSTKASAVSPEKAAPKPKSERPTAKEKDSRKAAPKGD